MPCHIERGLELALGQVGPVAHLRSWLIQDLGLSVYQSYLPQYIYCVLGLDPLKITRYMLAKKWGNVLPWSCPEGKNKNTSPPTTEALSFSLTGLSQIHAELWAGTFSMGIQSPDWIMQYLSQYKDFLEALGWLEKRDSSSLQNIWAHQEGKKGENMCWMFKQQCPSQIF